ncbi:MAG TPA: ABC transporter substrate-binding protein [Sulfolobales archaeon]|nr:ABC transporter substrate-binding protein [Sulfolobales archaeon]
MYDYGARYIYIMYVNDAWGSGFARYVESRFKEIGGSVISKIGYDPDKVDFSAELTAAVSSIRDAIAKYGADKVAMLLISREEAATIASQAEGYPELMSITWFGTDGTALNKKILEVAGRQLAKVKLISHIFAPTESPKYIEFAERFRARVGEDPGTWPALVYDCTVLIGLAIIETGKYDGEAIRNALPLIAQRHFGVSGWTLLDENGDRAGGSYDAWAVVMKDGKPSWERVAVIDVATDTVSWVKRV